MSVTIPRAPDGRALGALFLVSASSLLLEVTLVRLLSVALWYPFAFSALATAAALLLFRAPAFSNQVGSPPERFPAAASQAVEKLPAAARILASDSYGGYLIYRFNGARKVYFDGRSDFYGPDFLERYLALMAARPGWRETVAAERFTHALLPGASPLTGALQQAGWAVLYKDGIATLLEAR